MKWRGLVLIGLLASLLSGFYLMAARVYYEGSLGESDLVLKPAPSLDIEVGGGEVGAWARAHPGQARPWWQSDHLTLLAWGGDWEQPVAWTSFYEIGILATPCLWLALIGGGVWRVWRRRRPAS